MKRTIRSGFEAARKLTLSQENDRGVVADASAAERLAMVWPITQSCWAFVPGSGDHAQREFQRHSVAVIGLRHLLVNKLASGREKDRQDAGILEELLGR